MHGLDSRALGLLPALGLCSCVVASEGATRDPESPTGPAALAWIEADAPRQPLTVYEAAVRSGHDALAQGHFAAARELLGVALSYGELAPEAFELRLARVDALIGMREFDVARRQLAELGTLPADDDAQGAHHGEQVRSRRMSIRELEHAIGFEPCETSIDARRQPLTAADDFVGVWNELRAGLPEAAEIPIPSEDGEARVELCGACANETEVVALHLDQRSVWGLVLPEADGGLTVVPQLLQTSTSTCEDDVEITYERRGDLLWVRAFSDAREEFDPSEWDLGSEVALGNTAASSGYQSSGYYAGSSGYQSSGYYAGSSGYQSSGYQSSGYQSSYAYNYGYGHDCGSYYEPYYCQVTGSIERDIFIDLRSREIVLDIIRTGTLASPLGTVELDAEQVHVDACGVEQTLALSFASA